MHNSWALASEIDYTFSRKKELGRATVRTNDKLRDPGRERERERLAKLVGLGRERERGPRVH